VSRTNVPLIDLEGVVTAAGGLRPLRVKSLQVAAGDRIVLAGFDADAAASIVHLITGAAVPEQGEVRIAGRPTTAIAADTEWLVSLDRFGLVTERAVFVQSLSIAANLALPITIAVDPMADDVRRRVEALAALIDLPAARLDDPAGSLTAAERMRVHLARAVAIEPDVLLLEHPTAALAEDGAGAAFGSLLARVSEARGCGWVALSEDRAFASASGGRRLRLRPATGDLVDEDAGWRAWFNRR
jgi:predicted ABC-type transport system involved in lysophospholipase L1 biosynthesis ATPase subunit